MYFVLKRLIFFQHFDVQVGRVKKLLLLLVLLILPLMFQLLLLVDGVVVVVIVVVVSVVGVDVVDVAVVVVASNRPFIFFQLKMLRNIFVSKTSIWKS